MTKKLWENFFSLSVLKGADYLLPLLTVPYLVRVLGPEKFGLAMFAQAFIQYFIIFTDYGFDFSSTREVSTHRTDKSRLSTIFSAVISAKLLLTLLSLLIVCVTISVFDKFRADSWLYLVTFGAVFGKVLFPQWLFQGMERMKFTSAINIVARMLFIALIFVYVRAPGDYILVNLFYALGLILAGLTGQYAAWRYFGVSWHLPKIWDIGVELQRGYYIFVGQIAGTLYTASNVFILGLLANNTVVGYYSAGEKIVKAVQSLFNPVSQAVFPHISYLVSQSKANALRFIRKLSLLSGGITFILSLAMFVFAPQIVAVALGGQYGPSVMVIRILSFLPFVCSLGNILGTQLMINFGLSLFYARIITFAGFFNVIAAFILIPFYKQNGIALSVFLTELLITMTMFVILEIKNLSPRKRWIKKMKGAGI